VAQLVLQDNYNQTKVLSFMQALGKENIDIYQDFIKILESEVQLNRDLESLPDDDTFDRRRLKGQGMTRPELAIILAYSKMMLVKKILASNIVDDPNHEPLLISYFPSLIQNNYHGAILKHPLRREILGTLMANTLINQVGPTFVHDVCRVRGYSPAEVVRGFFLAVRLLNLDQIWRDVDNLDPLMVSPVQMKAYADISQSLKTAVLRILETPSTLSLEDMRILLTHLMELTEGKDKQQILQEWSRLQEVGLPQDVIEKLVLFPYLSLIVDIESVQMGDVPLLTIAQTYFKIRSHFNLDLIQEKTLLLEPRFSWQRTAQLGLLDDISQLTIALTQNVIYSGYTDDLEAWLESQDSYLKQSYEFIAQVKGISRPDIGILTFAIRQLQRLPRLGQMLCTLYIPQD
jgi:glutamate dehydrogenase